MNNKGFTIIELLVGFLILALVSGIGIVSYNSITDRVEKNYYETMENELLLAGNEYFSNYRGDKPLTGYNKVDISKLIDNKYIEKLKDTDGKECKVPNNEESSVYIYKNENDYLYEVCLICNDYKSKGNYCGGNVDGVISIKATSNNKEYNPLLSYSNVSWTNNDVTVEFSMPNTVSKYVVINTATNQKRECTASNNTCTMTFSDTSSYMVEAYNNGVKVGTEKDFNIKVDKVAPTFDIDETTELIIEALPLTYSYVNEVKNLKDNLGIKNVIYTLTGNGINETIDITDTTKVNKTLSEGNYKLTVTASDFAGNTTTKTVDFIVKYKYILISKPDTSYCSSPVYDGSSQTLTKTAGTGFSFSNNTGTNAGSYNVSVTLDPAYQWDNYTSDKLTIICSIGKRAVTYKADDATKEYDGTALTKQTAKLVSGNLVSGHIASFSISGSITNAGTATNTLDSVTIRNSSGTDVTSNYEITRQNGTLSVTRKGITAPGTSYCKSLTYNGSSQILTNAAGTGFSFTNNTGTNAGSYDVTAVLNGNYQWSTGSTANQTISCSIGKKSVTYKADSDSKVYDGSALTKNTATLVSGSLVSGHTATFSISGSITNVGSVTNTLNSVTIKSGSTDVSSNYDITRQNGTLTITRKGITAPGTSYCSNPTYNGSSQTLTNNAGTGFSFTNNTGTNAGSYNVPAVLNGNYQWSDGTTSNKTISCSIGKKSVTYKADDATKEYDGTALTKQTATLVSGNLVSGHVASFSISGSITNAGTATNTLDSVTIRNSSGTDVTSNYSITKQNGTLTVNITVTYIDAPTSSSYCKTLTYNGSSQTLTNAAGTGFSFTNNTGTNAGSYTVSAVLNNNYRWSDGTSANKTITCNIEKKLVTYTASSASRAWNGAALTNQTASLTSGSLISGHTATFTITGSQTSVGSSTNTLNSVTIKSGSTDVSSNYSITKVNGTLTVTTSLSCSISEADSTFTASASGDSGNYQYSWNGGGYSTTKTLARGNATSVNVTVRDTTSGGTATCNMTCTYGNWGSPMEKFVQSCSEYSKATAIANGKSYYRLCSAPITNAAATCSSHGFNSPCYRQTLYNRTITCS